MTSPNGQSSDIDPGQIGFEDAFRQLTAIAETLEAGGLTLAEATARYEQGMKLVQHCNNLLDSAELEITTLRENYQRPATPLGRQDNAEPSVYDEAPYDELPDDEDELPF
jgi:exodeoxyribonuclease VII small subunit